MRMTTGNILYLLLISIFSIFSGIYYIIYSFNELSENNVNATSLGILEKPEVIIVGQAFVIAIMIFILPLGWLYIAENYKRRREE